MFITGKKIKKYICVAGTFNIVNKPMYVEYFVAGRYNIIDYFLHKKPFGQVIICMYLKEGDNMILYLGATKMIIKRLEIKGLYGIYDYNVQFNDDLTFIYGVNGCGKTTILSIVTSIVTGKIYNSKEKEKMRPR